MLADGAAARPPAAYGTVRYSPAGMCRMTQHRCAVGHRLVAAHRGVLHNGADCKEAKSNV